MTIILVDGLGYWVEREVEYLPPYYNVVMSYDWRSSLDEILIFKFDHTVDYLGRYVYRQMGFPEVPIRYPRTEPDDDLDRALNTIVEREQEKELDRGLNDFLGDSPIDDADLPELPDAQANTLEYNVARAAELRLRIKALEAELEPIDQHIIDGCFAKGATSHSIPGWKANIENKTTRTIIREKLVARGVEVSIIDEATKTSVSDPFVKFYKLKGPEAL